MSRLSYHAWRAFATVALLSSVSGVVVCLLGHGAGVTHWGMAVPYALAVGLIVPAWWRLVR